MQENKNTIVTASFINDSGEKTLKDKKCVLLVSVGQKYHEGEKLLATIELINRSLFDSCVIAVADTLQRHNFLDKTGDEAYQLSLESGDAWLQRNKTILEQLKPEATILRWDEALADPSYAELKMKIEEAYCTNSLNYKDAVDSTIGSFLERAKRRDPNADLNLLFSNCLKYLIEECPIIMPLWASQGYDFVIYPKAMTKAMAATQEIFVKPYFDNKGNWLSLKFKKNRLVGHKNINTIEIEKAS